MLWLIIYLVGILPTWCFVGLLTWNVGFEDAIKPHNLRASIFWGFFPFALFWPVVITAAVYFFLISWFSDWLKAGNK